MKHNKKIILLSISILMVFTLLFFAFNKQRNVVIIDNASIAIMLETEPGVYTKSQSNNWPSDEEHVFDSEKSYCVNDSILIWSVDELTIQTKGSDKCYAYFKDVNNVSNEISKRILEFNGGKKSIEQKSHPFDEIADTNEGMYAMEDDYGTSYYFRGAVDNNWVKFANYYWRIVRINGDGSVKLIYTGTSAPTEEEKVLMIGHGTNIGTSAFNALNQSGEYIGYMYTLGEHRGHSTSSTIKTKLDTWYIDNLLPYEEHLNDFVVCNDRGFDIDNYTPIGLPNSIKYSDAYRRLFDNNAPQLICPHKEDRYTVSDTTIGNGQLTYPIGLLSADEATLAGGYKTTENNYYYLFSYQRYWLLSSVYVNGSYPDGFNVSFTGHLDSYSVINNFYVRPVISLSSDIEMTGSGKYNDPYRLAPKVESFNDLILTNNGGKSHIKDKSHALDTISETNEGMYATTDDYGTSYYFRGAVDNNWVEFAGNYWRIVRINGDGSIKMIYTGTEAPTEAQKVVKTGNGTGIGTSTFNLSREAAEYQGYMYTLDEHRGHSTNSEIKTTLDTWYTNNLSYYENYLSDFVVCNDRGYTVDDWTPLGLPDENKYSNAYHRLRINNTPQLICSHKEDRYTVNDTVVGNGKLTYPIGLLTADEVTLAGGYRLTENNSYYLYTNEYYWLMTPFSALSDYASGFIVDSGGYVGGFSMYNPLSVRPVISLSSNLSASGTGFWNDPYKFSDNFVDVILMNNGGKFHIEGKFHKSNGISTTNEGMYAIPDDYGTSYYFRGAVDNNWVKFGKENGNDIWWRIVRINGDGSIKLIYTGTNAPTEAQKVTMTGAGTHIGISAFNTLYQSAEYMGYMYTMGEHRGHSTSSTIKTTLETWYTNNLSPYEEYLSDFVACNDRGFAIDNWTPIGLPSVTKYSDVHRRIFTYKTPQLICPHKEDRYTVTDTTMGNGQLTKPIGLLTADEVALAGGYTNIENSSYYLYTNQNYWSLSPVFVNIYYIDSYYVAGTGHIGNYSVVNKFGVRPVVSLSSNVSVSGTGHWNDPYIVKQL